MDGPASFFVADLRKRKMSFDSLNLHEALVRAVTTAGYTAPTDVQTRAIPPAMAGQDLMVSSNTGSGKTASFVLPALMRQGLGMTAALLWQVGEQAASLPRRPA